MLKIILYHNSSDVFDFSFIKDESRPLTIVTPNPAIADFNRLQLNGRGDALTISKFMNDLLAHYDIQGDGQIKRKSELLLWLATVWKSRQKNPQYEQFINAFNTFTNLRSFTMDSQFLNELSQFLDSELVDAIQYFWMIFENQKINDEHSAYYKLTEFIRHEETLGDDKFQNFVFNGFSFLSGNQIDFLNALSIKHDVYIPFPKKVYDNCRQSDWVRWMGGECVEIGEKLQLKPTDIKLFTKNTKNDLVGEFFCQNEKDRYQIILGQKNPDVSMVSRFGRGDLAYRASVNLFEEFVNSINQTLLDLSVGSSGKLPCKDVIENFSQKIEKELDEKDKNFRKIKVLQEYIKILNQYLNLSDLNNNLRPFDVVLVSEVVSLNLPRNYLNSSGKNGVVFGVESLEFADPSIPTLILAESGQTGFLSSESSQQEELWELFSAIGPIKRNSLESDIYAFQLEQFLSKAQRLTIAIESDLIEHDLFWSQFTATKKKISFSKKSEYKTINQKYLTSIIGSITFPISVSHFQLLQECSFKFYYESVLKIKPFLKMKEMVLANELGTLEHKIIEKFFEEKHSDLNKLAEDVWIRYKEKNSINPPLAIEKRILLELKEYCGNAVSVLQKLNFNSFKFEHSFKSEYVSGGIDCILFFEDGIIVIDFKRSDSSVPTAKDLNEFTKIQLWHYCLVAKNIFDRPVLGMGYINLSDIEESRFIMDGQNTNLISQLVQLGIKPIIRNFEEELSKYNDHFVSQIEKWSGVVEFLPNPLSKKVCSFCSLNTICSKGGRA
ncbi:MAG: hypothetical protein OHK0056_08520 [Bacteriovoracaceae bacterium]